MNANPNKQKGEGEVGVLILAVCIAILYGIFVLICAGIDKVSEYKQGVEKAHFSTFSQRITSYVPFASNESDKLALKIDELMATKVVLTEKKEETRTLFQEYDRSVAVRKDRINTNYGNAYDKSLIAQESEYRDKIGQKFNSLDHAVSEIDYLIEYAKNRYKMIGSDKERSEMIDRINALTSKSRNGAR